MIRHNWAREVIDQSMGGQVALMRMGAHMHDSASFHPVPRSTDGLSFCMWLHRLVGLVVS